MTVTELRHERFTLTAPDEHEIPVQTWQPVGATAVVIQILHGLGEHGDRYARFAKAATRRGHAVCIHDHRGHGGSRTQHGHFADRDGWQRVLDDTRVVNQFARESFAERPVVLLGHSMGSFIAQNHAMHYGGLSALILSASTWPSRLQLLIALALARIEAWHLGKRGYSPLLYKLGFNNYNKAFRPARTERDWLSRDSAEVDKYMADPLCGGPFSCGLWLDLLGGLFEISSDRALSRIPTDLPILISGGESDPVGGDKGMTKLLQHYAQTSHQRLKVKIYEDGRHEMLNETNRDQVTADWLDWIDVATRSARSG